MLSRKQLKLLQTASGLSLEAIVQRSGIPRESLTTLLGSDNGKDPKWMIGEATYQRVLALLGIDADFEGLRNQVVIPWRCLARDRKGENAWMEAFAALRPEMLSNQLRVTEVEFQGRLFTRPKSIVFAFDQEKDLRIAIYGATGRVRAHVLATLTAEHGGTVRVMQSEFASMCEQIDRGVYGSVRFDSAIGGQVRRYDWADVKASAQEFGFQTDDLIALMLDEIKRREQKALQVDGQKDLATTVVNLQAYGG